MNVTGGTLQLAHVVHSGLTSRRGEDIVDGTGMCARASTVGAMLSMAIVPPNPRAPDPAIAATPNGAVRWAYALNSHPWSDTRTIVAGPPKLLEERTG